MALGVLSALADGTASLCDLRVNGMASPANVGVKPSFSWKTPSTYAWNGAIDKKIITFDGWRMLNPMEMVDVENDLRIAGVYEIRNLAPGEKPTEGELRVNEVMRRDVKDRDL